MSLSVLLIEASERVMWLTPRVRAERDVGAPLARALRSAFETQLRLFLKRFASLKVLYESQVVNPFALDKWVSFYESASAMDVNPLMDDAFEATNEAMVDAVQSAAEAALMAGGDMLIANIGAGFISFNLEYPAAQEYLAEYGARRVTQINETTRKRINKIVADAAERGDSWQKTARLISAEFEAMAGPPLRGAPSHIGSRAQLIAVTEVGEAFERGARGAARELVLAGFAVEKKRIGPNDKRTSDACKGDLAIEWIDLNDTFPSGIMDGLHHPGCRHGTVYQRKVA